MWSAGGDVCNDVTSGHATVPCRHFRLRFCTGEVIWRHFRFQLPKYWLLNSTRIFKGRIPEVTSQWHHRKQSSDRMLRHQTGNDVTTPTGLWGVSQGLLLVTWLPVIITSIMTSLRVTWPDMTPFYVTSHMTLTLSKSTFGRIRHFTHVSCRGKVYSEASFLLGEATSACTCHPRAYAKYFRASGPTLSHHGISNA